MSDTFDAVGIGSQGLELRPAKVPDYSIDATIHAVATGPDPERAVAVLERLIALKRDTERYEAEKAFARDLVLLQSEIPQIDEHGRIMNKGGAGVRSTYAKWEDVDTAVRPLMTKYGFSFCWAEEDVSKDARKFSSTLLHRDGHSRTISKTIPFDKSDFRSEAQSESSTTSLARRQLMRMQLNIVTKGTDVDGSKIEKIDEKLAGQIKAAVKRSGMPEEKFLAYMQVTTFEEILVRDTKKAETVIRAAEAEKAKLK